MGDLVGGGVEPALGRLEGVFCAGHIACGHLRTSDRCHHAAKRRGGGPGGRLRRCGQPNGIRPARSGHISLQGDNVVRHHVHADVHGVDDASEFGCGVGWQLRAATVLEDFEAAGTRGSSSSSTGVSAGITCSRGACAFEIDCTLKNPAARPLPLGSKFFHLTSCGSGGTGRRTILRGWRRKAWGFESPLPHQNVAIFSSSLASRLFHAPLAYPLYGRASYRTCNGTNHDKG